MKSREEAMQILEAFDLTRSYRAAARLAGCAPLTVRRLVQKRAEGRLGAGTRRSVPSKIDPYRPKIEEWVRQTRGNVRADVCHRKLAAMGFAGSERTVRRAVARAKDAYRSGNRRVFRPWIAEPGMWAQWDWADAGPIVGARRVYLFCAWLAWSRFRVVIPVRNRRQETVIACLDRAMRAFGGAPTYWLTDNERTITTGHVANLPVRHPLMVSFGAWYGVTVATCERADPQTKGGSEATVRIAKQDLVPTDANLLPEYGSWSDLEDACARFLDLINARPHRVTGRPPREMLASERETLHRLPEEAFTVAFGLTRKVSGTALITYGRAQYSVPHALCGESVWVRTEGDELVVTAAGGDGPREVARHRCAAPGARVVNERHYPSTPPGPLGRRPRPRSVREREFLQIGPCAERWLIAAAAAGTPRLGAKLEEIVTLARLQGAADVDLALGVAANCERFGFGDVAAILDAYSPGPVLRAGSANVLQDGTAAWARLGAEGEADR